MTAQHGYGQGPYGTSPYGCPPNTTYFGDDALNRLDKVLDASGGHAYFGYDPGGNTHRVLDALGRPTYFAYDKLDRFWPALRARYHAAASSRNVSVSGICRSRHC